jgi:NAD-dependent dihydropyrimidine dehydrogenase PreA subunit
MHETDHPANLPSPSGSGAGGSDREFADHGPRRSDAIGLHADARPAREGDKPAAAFNPIRIDEQKCVRCDLCDWICPGDLIYHEEGNKAKLPVVAYPDECWYCGLCQSICPTQAIEVVFPEQMIRNTTDVASLLGKIVE